MDECLSVCSSAVSISSSHSLARHTSRVQHSLLVGVHSVTTRGGGKEEADLRSGRKIQRLVTRDEDEDENEDEDDEDENTQMEMRERERGSNIK